MAAAQVRVEGELLGFTFRAEDGGFSVARVRDTEGVQFIAVGPLGHVTEGQHLVLQGRWLDHPQFGRQLKVASLLVEDPRTTRGLERYLGSGAVVGLGKEFARRVVQTFGLDTLAVIEEEPERLLEVPGIGHKRMTRIRDHWQVDQTYREVHATLHGYGIGRALANKIVDKYAEKAPSIIHAQPYRLAAEMPGVGFLTADRIARDVGIAEDAPERADAAVIHLLREGQGSGHCFLPRRELCTRGVALGLALPAITAAIERLRLHGDVVVHQTLDPEAQPIYHPVLERAEARVAARVLELLADCTGGQPIPAPMLDKAEEHMEIALNLGQRQAVSKALQGGVTVITGGPGTGKTTIVRMLMAMATARKEHWRLAAPTGRAARRLAEATGADARTIHRLLEFNGRTGRFSRTASNPLECHGVLIDEASMVDIRLMASLLAALPEGCRLVLVGDADQLPSVGAGRVLADIIASGQVPVCTLTEVYRQAQDSGIVRNAHRINQGESPVSGEQEEGMDDFFEIHRSEPLEAQATILQIVTERLKHRGFDPLKDVQVLTPMHSGPLGTQALNQALQRALNPAGPGVQRGPKIYREGDRVIQLRNDYDNDIFNGDVGIIVRAGGGVLTVDFDGRSATLRGEALGDIDLAYAITIHKSQGSEYPAVVVALHRAHFVMLRRNLLYTAITRAQRFCCVVGDRWAIRTAVATRGGDERWTRLSERLQPEWQKQDQA
jgi:exodeoxyribonuclease V alpha subunit